MRSVDQFFAIVVVGVIGLGLILSFLPDTYSYDLNYEESEDGIRYTYGSNVEVDTTTVLMKNSGLFHVRDAYGVFDKSYASINPANIVEDMLEGLGKHLSVRNISYDTLNALAILEIMSAADPSSTAIIIATGSIPDAIYDGTVDCPLIDWLNRGGVVVSVATCLGKYISHGPEDSDIECIEGYGVLFADTWDSNFNDAPNALYADQYCNEDIREALNFQMNDYSKGVWITGIRDALNLGYMSSDGYSAACAYRSGSGMVLNFGVNISTHDHFNKQIAQIIASGVDYDTEVLSIWYGDTQHNNSGIIKVGESNVIYGYIGSTNAVYADRYDSVR